MTRGRQETLPQPQDILICPFPTSPPLLNCLLCLSFFYLLLYTSKHSFKLSNTIIDYASKKNDPLPPKQHAKENTRKSVPSLAHLLHMLCTKKYCFPFSKHRPKAGGDEKKTQERRSNNLIPVVETMNDEKKMGGGGEEKRKNT